ncbi:MAG: AarF/ABC1/UbiB kinase family protein [Kofleriaceae bacterium]
MRNVWFILYYLIRSVAVTCTTLTFTVAFAIVAVLAPHSSPSLFRRYLQWCGGGFIKLGQVLAMRFDMLPRRYYRELGKLLDQVPPISIERIRKILAVELGPRVADLQELEPDPLGTASIAQVHGARLSDGTEIVLKIMRPGVASRLRIDLANLRFLAWLVDTLGIFGGRDVTGLVAEVVRLSIEELDFRREAFQADLMRHRLEADALDHRAPRIYFDYCTSRVIAMERFRGVWVRDLIRLVEDRNGDMLATLELSGISPRRTARLILHSILTQCLVHRVFHADPHAANIVILTGGTIGYIDFGMLGRLDERIAGLQLRVIEGIATEEYEAAFAAMLATIEPLATRDLGEFQARVQDLFAEWRMIATHPAATIAEKSSGLFFLRVADLVRRAGLQLPARMMRYYRAQIVCDMAIYGLDPDLDPTAEFALFFRRRHEDELAQTMSIDRIARLCRALVIDGPRAAEALTRWAELRLPRLGEAYEADVGGIVRGVAALVNAFQRGFWLAGITVVGLVIAGQRAIVERSQLPWWALCGALVVLAIASRRVHRAMTAT